MLRILIGRLTNTWTQRLKKLYFPTIIESVFGIGIVY